MVSMSPAVGVRVSQSTFTVSPTVNIEIILVVLRTFIIILEVV